MAISLYMRGRSLMKACGAIRHFFPSSRNLIHSSVYRKNEDEGVHLSRVPEDALEFKKEKWWAPHPKTGVFGPIQEHGWTGDDHHNPHEKSGESVLEQQAWFRNLEDVQKQPSN